MSETISALQNDCLSLRVQLDQANETIDAQKYTISNLQATSDSQERIEADLRAGLERARSKLAELDELRGEQTQKRIELERDYARCANARNVIAAEMQGLRERADSRIDAVERSCWDLRERLIAAETRERQIREALTAMVDHYAVHGHAVSAIDLVGKARAALAASPSIQTCDKCGGSRKV